jgi:hypothetical protein
MISTKLQKIRPKHSKVIPQSQKNTATSRLTIVYQRKPGCREKLYVPFVYNLLVLEEKRAVSIKTE